MHFYNTASVKEQCPAGTPVQDAIDNNCWPPPENAGLIPGPLLLGALGLTEEQEYALTAHLQTLNDRFPVLAPKQPRR